MTRSLRTHAPSPWPVRMRIARVRRRVGIETEEGHIKTVDAETQTENIKMVDNQTQTKEIRAHPVVIKTKDLHDFDDNAEDNDTVEGQSRTMLLSC